VKRTLARWVNPNTQRTRRSSLISFYDWAMEEGYRKDNPARQTRRPKKRQAAVYRLTRDEAVSMLLATETRRERWAIYLGICAGLRRAELLGLQGRHFERPRLVWVSANIAKGGKERWVPVIQELSQVAAEIRSSVAHDEYVLPAQRFRDPPFNRRKTDLALKPSSPQALRTLVMEVARRAGIAAHIHPHLMRHAYADHIARYAGARTAQFLLGHAGIATTETYLGEPTIEELQKAVDGFAYGVEVRTDVLGGPEGADIAQKAPTGIEPVYTALQAAA
jgi:integrase/recombinase XerC